METKSALVKNSPKLKKIILNDISGWLFASPLVIGMAIFTLLPIVQSLIYSFHIYDGADQMIWYGIRNYADMFTGDREIGKVFSNTFIYAVISVPLTLTLSYLLATLANQKVKGISVFRVLFYMPVVIPGVVAGVIWKDIMSYPQGGFNSFICGLGLDPFPFLTAPNTAMLSVFIMSLWSLGGGMVLWIAAFKNIPNSLYEAAKLDGAGPITRFRCITIPLSTPMIFFNLVSGVIGALQISATMVYAPYNGKGVSNSLYFIAVKIYQEAFQNWSMGYASAIAWVLFIIIGILTVILFKTSGWVKNGEEL